MKTDAATIRRRCLRALGIIALGCVVAVLLWMNTRVEEPQCYVEYTYVPALDKTLNSPLNNTLFYTLMFHNKNANKELEYDDVHLSFAAFVGPNATRPLGNATVENFYQDYENQTYNSGSLLAEGNLSGSAVYRLYFATEITYKYRYEYVYGYTGHYPLWGGANVEIGNSGLKVNPKPLRLGHYPATLMIQSGVSSACTYQLDI